MRNRDVLKNIYHVVRTSNTDHIDDGLRKHTGHEKTPKRFKNAWSIDGLNGVRKRNNNNDKSLLVKRNNEIGKPYGSDIHIKF